ncbi:MAG: outer membrane protein assembly factor BamA [Hyphomonadaceae bacterium]
MRSWFAGALALTASASAILASQEMLGIAGAAAQESSDVISRILVENNQRIEARTVLSYMLVKPGDPYDANRLDLSLKALIATGLFADVLFERRGNDLVVRVIENPIINRVIFEGNNAVTTERLEEETEAEPRATFTRSRVEQDVQKILEVYRRAGRFAATVTPQYKPLPQNRADLIFVIEEGPKTGIRSINFLGNEHFSDSRLRREIATRQSKWWRFFEKRDNYNPGQVEYDREQLREFYTNEGYADFRTIAAVAELTPDRRDFYLTFTVDEGEQYDFGKVSVETELEKLSGERLSLVLPMKQGDLYRAKSIEDAVDTITFAAGTAGYANVEVNPIETRNPDTHTIDIKFEVDEGPRVYVERIDIVGNTQTLDRVIRREIRVAEGDAFNRVLLDNARNRIRALGFFDPDKVEITEEPGSADDRTVVNVKVEERPTGELAFAAGFSSADAYMFSASYSQPNFRGRGQYVSARVTTTSRQQDIEFRFTEPKFQDRNLSVGLDLLLTESDFIKEAGFRNSVVGGGARMLFPLSDRESFGLQYNLRSDDLQIDSAYADCESASLVSSFCDQLGKRLTSSIRYSLSSDHTNDFIEPTRGYRFNFSQEVAGLGGDVNYLRNEFQGSWYRGLFPEVVASAKLSAGYIESFGDDRVRINNRFFKGGNSFRGFDVAGLGPRQIQYEYQTETLYVDEGLPPPPNSIPLIDTTTNVQVRNPDDAGQLAYRTALTDDAGNLLPPKLRRYNALGGKAYAIGTLELSFPVPYAPEELGIGGALFTEFGTLGVLDEVDRDRREQVDPFTVRLVDDSASLRASAGVSIFWDSPFGPIQFDFSKILAHEDYDRTETFRFSTSTRF